MQTQIMANRQVNIWVYAFTLSEKDSQEGWQGKRWPQRFDGKQILKVNTAPFQCPLVSLISDHFAFFWDNFAFGFI